MIRAAGKALRGRALTRHELADAVVERTGLKRLGNVLRQSWGVLLKPCAYRGQLCFAEGEGARVRFTHPGPVRAMDRQEALAELTRRYLRAYGPATRDDFATWWGDTTRAQSQQILESVGADPVELAGSRAWILTGAAPQRTRSVRLLPAFDPYVVGAPRSGGLFPAEHKARIYRPQGWISPVLLVDGHAEGIWRSERSKAGLEVYLAPFGSLPARARSGAAEEAERLAAFFGAPLRRLVVR